jgi:Rrf2 family transcriptional regulator, iron-sulfur cluster assembly transcription factor
MKLTTRSLYGTRLLLDMAQYYGKGPIKLGMIAKRQKISVKYLEQIIRPLNKANYIESFCGPKGGHILSKPPDQISVGEIVALLEGSSFLTPCSNSSKFCNRSSKCLTRHLWIEASRVLFDFLNQVTFADLLLGKCISRFSKE